MLPETQEALIMLKLPARIQQGIRLIEKKTEDSLFMALCEGEDVDGFMAELKETGDFSQIIFENAESYPTLFSLLYTDDLLEAVNHYEHGFHMGEASEDLERYFWNLWSIEINRSWLVYLEDDIAHAAEAEEEIADMLREPES